MSSVVIAIYHFLHRNKATSAILMILTLSFIIYFASGIRFKEDISGTISSSAGDENESTILQNFKFSDKLIVMLSQTDSSKPADPASLCSFATGFIEKLNARFDTTYLKSVTGQIADTSMTWYLDFFYRNIPFYLSPADYLRIDSMIQPARVKKILTQNYRLLASPAGFAVKNQILKDPLGLTYLPLNRLRELQGNDKYLMENGFILTKDRKNLILFINPANPASETDRNSKLLKGIDQLLTDISNESGGQISGEYFGSVAMSCGNADRIKKDIILTVTIAFFLIFLLIGVYFRSLLVPVLSILPALFGGGLALALIFLIKKEISAIALGIGSVILGLIVDYSLYVINHYRKKGDVIIVLKELSLTLFLCAITSIGAFLCMIFLKSTVLFDLGLFASISIAGAVLFALIILPHLLPGKGFNHRKPGLPFIDKIANYSFEKNYWLIILLLLFGIISFFTFSRAGFETDMMAMNYYPGKLKTAEKHIDQVTGGSLRNVYLVSAGKSLNEALSNHEQQQGLIDKLKNENVIRQYSGIGTLLPSAEKQEEQLRYWKSFWTPEKTGSLTNLILTEGKKLKFKETAFQPFLMLLHKQFSAIEPGDIHRLQKEQLSDWITASEDVVMVSSILRVEKGDEQVIYNTFPSSENQLLFDRQSLTNQFVDNVRKDFDLLVKLSMIFVTLLLLFSLGRIELAVIAALPMYLSWLITLGFMGMTGARFNIFNIIVSSFIFGLGVDYSILMLRGLLHEAKYGTNDLTSYKVSIILSSATTLFGVGALFFAKHPALHSIALISVIGIVLVVIISFTLQPLIANECFVDRPKRRKYPVTARIIIKTFITWGNIVLVAAILTISGLILRYLLPIPKKNKEQIFHSLFRILSKCYIQITFPPKSRKLFNPQGETFKKPAVIISNHQSLIETPAFLRMHSKIIILTTTWVYKSVVFGPVARLASFFNADLGIDNLLDDLKLKVSEGYSILVFPEAHRSVNGEIQRFHKGAFYLAEKLNIDILPVVLFGTGDFLGRGEFWGRPNSIFMKILPRVRIDDISYGKGYRERTKNFRQYYIREYDRLKTAEGTGRYYRRKTTLNYIYKGPILEWYFRIKLRLANNYQLFCNILPRTGKILDLGCGYGFISTMMYLTGTGRTVTGVDYDEEKISVAENCYLTSAGLSFVCSDVVTYPITPHDAFLISDVLHYLGEEQQEQLLLKCIENLNPGGLILIREADKDKMGTHRITRLTEYFSTRVLAFNKTQDDSRLLHFTSMNKIESFGRAHGMVSEIIKEGPNTSNILMVMRKDEN